ncbi:hypothetical protein J6590_106455 [Homalodisca vitripennis]|nr:hypothetical protein J6590_106455 [Homalodisca vitripennis]
MNPTTSRGIKVMRFTNLVKLKHLSTGQKNLTTRSSVVAPESESRVASAGPHASPLFYCFLGRSGPKIVGSGKRLVTTKRPPGGLLSVPRPSTQGQTVNPSEKTIFASFILLSNSLKTSVS